MVGPGPDQSLGPAAVTPFLWLVLKSGDEPPKLKPRQQNVINVQNDSLAVVGTMGK